MAYNYNCFYPNPDSGPNYVCMSSAKNTNNDPNCLLTSGSVKVDLGDGNCYYRDNTALAPEDAGRAVINCKGGIKIYAGDNSQRPGCEIDADQTIYPGVYYIGDFTVDSGKTLSVTAITMGSAGGGSGYSGAPSEGCAGSCYTTAIGGLNGGVGGVLLSRGATGTTTLYGLPISNFAPLLYSSSGGKGGGLLILYTHNFILNANAKIKLAGANGDGGGKFGVTLPGGGGGGGGGGGKLVVYTDKAILDSSSQISAPGGTGGVGGTGQCTVYSWGCKKVGTQCHEQGNGGAGGGGNGGSAEFYIRDASSKSVVCGTGQNSLDLISEFPGGGPNGNSCSGAAYTSQKGADGAITKCDVNELKEYYPGGDISVCNDGIDNDGNGFTDMNDSACFNITSDSLGPGACPSINYGYISAYPPKGDFRQYSSWFLPSAQNGNDACCGDDDPWNGNFERMADGTIGCSGMPAGWVCSSSNTNCQATNLPGYYMVGKCALNITRLSDPLTPTYANISINLAPGKYYYSVWAYSQGADNYAQANIVMMDASRIGMVGTFQWDKNRWELLNGTFTVLQNPVSIFLYNINSVDSSVFFDNLRIEKYDNNYYNPFNALEDFGFVDTSDQYMCYDLAAASITYATASKLNYTWLNAALSQNAFKIVTSATPFGFVDSISNGNNWFFCNATGKGGLGSKEIKEYGTFPSAAGNNKVFCKDVLTAITFNDLGKVFHDCESPTDTYCCAHSNGVSPSVDVSQFRDCVKSCYGVDFSDTLDSTNDLCGTALEPLTTYLCNPEIATPGGSKEFIKDPYMFDLTSYLNGTLYDYSKSCNKQAGQPNRDLRCDKSTQVCKNGIYVQTTEGTTLDAKPGGCCYGANAACADIADIPNEISDESNCTDEGGKLHDPKESDCLGDDKTITGSEQTCCFGGLAANLDSELLWYSSISPDSFECFKQNGQDVLGDCCENNATCPNIQRLNGKVGIDYSSNRVFSSGAVFHTIMNFDKFGTDGTLLDIMKRYTITSSSAAQISSNEFTDKGLDLSQFTYLEFDIAYDQQIPELWFNGRFMGNLSQYLVGGDKTMRWHHVVVPIDKTIDHTFKELDFNRSPGQSGDIHLLIDNIIVTPNGTDLQNNSKNMYCTGGFGTWIPDLDPNLALAPFNAPRTDWKWEDYGPYKLTCNSQGSFGWTGSQCCGDDTKLDNYGEFFNDTDNGCFNGTLMMPDWTVWKAKGVIDTSNSGLKDYIYKDLLYFNNTFIGCQVSPGKYNALEPSFNGNDKIGKESLVTKNIMNQCAMAGSYYCMDNVWREYIPGYNYFNTTLYKTVPLSASMPSSISGMNIQLKEAPPGGEIIYNGNFSGEDLSCNDNAKDGKETDIDCGGNCAQCIDGKKCASDIDCNSEYCDVGICTTLSNSLK